MLPGFNRAHRVAGERSRPLPRRLKWHSPSLFRRGGRAGGIPTRVAGRVGIYDGGIGRESRTGRICIGSNCARTRRGTRVRSGAARSRIVIVPIASRHQCTDHHNEDLLHSLCVLLLNGFAFPKRQTAIDRRAFNRGFP